MHLKKIINQKSFTLLELLIVLGILAILAVIVLLVINPAEFLRRTRDTKRQTDLQTLNSAIAFSQGIDFGLPLGLASTVYVSLPDSTTTCANLGLPALPPTWLYHCSNNADYQKTNGTGWIPINFNSLSTGSPLANLPVDPVNASTSNLYYVYVTGGSWALTGVFESQRYADISAKDGGHDPMAYEVGSDLKLGPNRPVYIACGSDCIFYHAYWDGTAVDHGPNGNNGTAYGSPNFVADGVQLNGVNQYIRVASSASLPLSNSFTIEGWLNVEPGWIPIGYTPVWISQYIPNSKIIFGLADAGNWHTYQSWFYDYVNQTGGQGYPIQITPGTWQHVVFNFYSPPGLPDSSPENYYTRVWTNGVMGSSYSGYKCGPLSATPAPLTIGGFFVPGDDRPFKGKIGELRIWNKILSQSEIQELFNQTKTRYGF